MEKEIKKIICKNCREENKSNARYCSSCGYELPDFRMNNSAEEIQVKDNSDRDRRNKNKKRNTIGLLLVVFVVVFLNLGAYLLFFKSPVYDKVLVALANDANKICPMIVDEYTTLDSISVLPGNTIQYNYTLKDIEKLEIDQDILKKNIELNALEAVKKSPEMQMLRKLRTTIVHNYKDENGVFIFEIPLTSDLYK